MIAWFRADTRRVLAVAVTALFLGMFANNVRPYITHWSVVPWGADFITYRDAAASWLAGGPFYHPYQLAGPYALYEREILYPPTALLLFVPFTILPEPLAFALWTAIPLGITGAVVWYHRPDPLWWPLLALAFVPLVSVYHLITGNPGMWAVAAVALGTVYGWPAVLVFLKPTLAPFALFGIRRRSWWLALLGLGLVSLLFAPMWFDYAQVVLNSRNPLGPLYSITDVPLLLIPLVAWAGSTRVAPARRATAQWSSETRREVASEGRLGPSAGRLWGWPARRE